MTVCPRLWFGIPRGPPNKQRRPYRFLKHNLHLIFYELEEEIYEFEDEARYRIGYEAFLDRLENGSMKPEELKFRT